MAVEDVYGFLKKNPGVFYTAQQLAEEVGLNRRNMIRYKKALMSYKDVQCVHRYSHSEKFGRAKKAWHYAYNKAASAEED